MTIVTVKINGVEYNLKGDEREEYLHKVAGYVDKKVKNILENNTKLSTSSAAILSAVNVVDDMFKKQKECEELIDKLNQIEKAQSSYMEQIETLKKQLNHMEQYNAELQLKLKNNLSNQQVEQLQNSVQKLTEELRITQETAHRYMKENSSLKSENKEFKFQLQSAKYKIIDLQHKLVENQINLAREKKQKHPFLKDSIK